MDSKENNPKEKERLEKVSQLLQVKNTGDLCDLLEKWSKEDCLAILFDPNLYGILMDKALEKDGDPSFIRHSCYYK